ncbi:MAG: hypothetical protein M3315_11890 [Actinomycetota bacterium]|nr:hypothetical protein [Actinomycetota bacterium]
MSRIASRAASAGLQARGKLRIAGVALISLVGLIHLLVTPEYYGFAAYLGLLMIANFAGSVVSAVGIYGGRIWGWILGAVMAGGAFLGYIESRTLGLPGLPAWEPFTEPPGLISLVVEALFVGLATYVLARRRMATTASSGGAA